MRLFAHEIAHARQHAVVSPDGSNGAFTADWSDTPEGRAFAEAREKDWETFGKVGFDDIPGLTSLLQNAAETCTYWWSREKWWNLSSNESQAKNAVKRYQEFEAKAPNRLKWAETWLDKR